MTKYSGFFRYFWLAFFLGFFVYCCQVGPDANNSKSPSLTASFTYSPASPLAGQAVRFTDTSTGSPTSWQWSFGDGGTSTVQNPAHTFSIAAAYTVTLTVTNASGSKNVSKSITVVSGLTASFTYSPASPIAGLAVQFTDTSAGGPTSWQWNFGDGSTSTAENPSHVFSATATYTITLKVSNNSGSKSTSQTISVLPASTLIVSFTYSPRSPNPGEVVQFTDTSIGSPTSWQWNFGDGDASTAQNPNHTFSTAASYAVTLTLMNNTDSNSASRTINVMPAITIIPPERLIDWSNAGVWYNGIKGIPTYPVGINLTGLKSYGGYKLDNTGLSDSRNAIQAALNACPIYNAVLLGPGSYMIGPSGSLSIPSYRVLRGTEPFTVTPQTTLIHNHSLTSSLIGMSGSAADYTPVVNVISCAKGSDAITVDGVTGFTVGDDVFIDEVNDPDFVYIGGTESTCTWCSRLNGTRSLNEVKRIRAIDAGTKTIQFERPLYRTYWNTPQLVRDVAASKLEINAGVESLRIINDGIKPVGELSNAIELNHSTYCWVKRVEVYDEYYKAILLQYYNLGCEVRECYIHGVPTGYSVSGNYAIPLADHNTDCLVENNICYHVHSSLTLGSGGSTANVIAYNYAYNEHHDSQPTWFLGGTGHHGAHPYMNLWEGNYHRKIFHDIIQGSSSHSIWFRNRTTGYPVSIAEPGENPAQPTVDQEMSVCNLPRYSYYVSIIGNILGTSGYDTVYEAYPLYLSTKQIWKLGFENQNDEGSPTDSKTAATIIRHGNYDYVTRSTIWDARISDHSLPNSLYLTAKPSFFGVLSWPAFGPDLNPMEWDIPAKYRFDAGTYFSDPPTK